MDWRIGAPCSTVDPDLFFDVSEDDKDALKQAKLICRGCPVAQQCLDTAMIQREEYGVWGGMTPSQRRMHRAVWQREKGGIAAVKTLRQTSGMSTPTPHIERKYKARREAATRCRELLSASSPAVDREEDYLMVLDMIISSPAEVSTKLANRIGRSATWFNSMKREVYGLFGISEKAND